MTVVMKGGTSGNREDAIVPMPGFDTQPMQNTAGNGGLSPMLQMQGGPRGTHPQDDQIASMPGGGTPDDSAT